MHTDQHMHEGTARHGAYLVSPDFSLPRSHISSPESIPSATHSGWSELFNVDPTTVPCEFHRCQRSKP